MAINVTHSTVATGVDAGNGEVRKTAWNANHVITGAVEILAQSAASVAVSATTSEEVLATITIPANAMGANGCVEIWASWSYTNSANSKTCRIRAGGIAGTSLFSTAPTTTNTLMRVTHWANTGATNSQKTSSSSGQAGAVSTSTGTLVTTSVDTTASVDIVITGQKASSGETLSLEFYQVNLMYKA